MNPLLINKDRQTISRPFSIFIEPATDLQDTWIAHIIGPDDLDHITQGQGPADALYMAYDVINMLLDRCPSDVNNNTHDYCIDSILDINSGEAAIPAKECKYCAMRVRPENLELVV